jgi:hypothetical protein
MGGACLRGRGHHWPAGGSGRPAARGRRESHLADEPDPIGANARPQLLRAAGHPDAVHHGHAQDEPDAVADPDPDAVALRFAVAFGDRGSQRFGDAVPLAVRDGNAVTVAQRQRETLDLALSQATQALVQLWASRIVGSAPSYRHRRSESPS